DGANDLEMMALAHYSVAYRAKPVVREKAAFALNYSALDAILNWFRLSHSSERPVVPSRRLGCSRAHSVAPPGYRPAPPCTATPRTAPHPRPRILGQRCRSEYRLGRLCERLI